MAETDDDGIDIVKFFLGVMSLLTVFVALFAAYNWSKARALEEEVQADQVDLESIERLAGDKAFLELVTRNKLYKNVEAITSKDFGRHIEEAATRWKVKLQSSNAVSSRGSASVRSTYDKKSQQFTVANDDLARLVDYLWYLQGSWPGLKIESLSLQKARGRRGKAPTGWQMTATASIFKPKAGAGARGGRR